MTHPSFLDSRGAILLCGFILAAIGLAIKPSAAPQGTGSGQGGPPAQTSFRTPPSLPAMGNADSNEAMIAVTGIDLTGSSILYLIDTQHRHLAVYQASGGSDSMQGLKLVGARKIDLDLQLDGFNDKSEYSFQELEKRFDEKKIPHPATPVK